MRQWRSYRIESSSLLPRSRSSGSFISNTLDTHLNVPLSELAWQLAHYRHEGVEVPGRIVSNPDLTEGEMMSDDEVEEFIKDSIATMRILTERQAKRLPEALASFQADMAYLKELGRISDDDYNGLTNQANLRF